MAKKLPMKAPDERLRQFTRDHLDAWAISQMEWRSHELHNWLERCESPIEHYMGVALSFARVVGFDPIPRLSITTPTLPGEEQDAEDHAHNWGVSIHRQCEIGEYRVDFMVKVTMGTHRLYAVVECDGHDFHERTKEQAARDKSRDRALMSRGLPVFRFTGSEIFRDADKCASEIAAYLEDRALALLDTQVTK